MLPNLFDKLENFLGNSSFLLLFVAMSCFWIQTVFSNSAAGKSPASDSDSDSDAGSIYKENKSKEHLSTPTFGFFNNNKLNLDSVGALDLSRLQTLNQNQNLNSFLQKIKKNKNFFRTINFFSIMTENFANFCILLTNFSLVWLLLLRWQNSGHFPLSNLYESLIFLCWSCTTIHIIMIIILKKKLINSLRTTNNLVNNSHLTLSQLLGCVLSPCALFINAYATFSLPTQMQSAAPLVPALQSNWLIMHVTVMILSYSALILGSLLAICFLIVTWSSNASTLFLNKTKTALTFVFGVYTKKDTVPLDLDMASSKPPTNSQDLELKNNNNNNNNNKNNNNNSINDFSQSSSETKLPTQILAKNLDNLSYRILGIGFPFLTIGILSGAVWANEAWGSYWSWDPKETWAFLTWLVFAIYLHMRLSYGWQGKKPALIASLGFLTVWFCFLGVNLLAEGLHSYGWVLN